MLAASRTTWAWPELNEPEFGDLKLTAAEANRLLALCIELIDLCSRITARVDPALGLIIADAHAEALSGVSAGPAET